VSCVRLIGKSLRLISTLWKPVELYAYCDSSGEMVVQRFGRHP